MLKAKSCIFTLQRKMLRNKNCNFVNKLITIKQTRSQTSAAALQKARPFEEIPTVSTFTMIRRFLPGGMYHNLDMAQVLSAIHKDYGELFFWPSIFGSNPFVVTHNPADYECVFRNEGVWPVRPGSDSLDHHRSKHRADFFQGVEGLVATKGEKWATFRTAVNPVLMQPKNVQLYLHKMSQVNLEFIERIKEIRDAKTFEVPATFKAEINRFTLESVSVVALDKQLGLIKTNRHDPDALQLFRLMTEFFTLTPELDFRSSLWRYIPTPKYKRLMKVFDEIQEITLKYVNEAIQRLEDEKAHGIERAEKEKSVLEKLLKLDKKIAIVMAMDMLMAGVDTTTSTLTALLLCLAKNPAKQEQLREEVRRIMPQKDADFPENALNDMPYLRACRKESMRIYPLIFGNGRALQQDVVLSGYHVPKDTHIVMATSDLYKDEKYYTRAGEFLPERWLRAGKEAVEMHALKASNPFIYLPFGFGPRSCIGRRIVEMELDLAVARIIRNFKVEYNYPTDNAFKALLINVPNIPLKFKFTDV